MLLSHHSSQINPVIFYCCPCATNTALSFKPRAIKNECPNEGVAVSSSSGAPETRPGGRATLSYPPSPRLAITKFW
jgi:hypothetical protein